MCRTQNLPLTSAVKVRQDSTCKAHDTSSGTARLLFPPLIPDLSEHQAASSLIRNLHRGFYVQKGDFSCKICFKFCFKIRSSTCDPAGWGRSKESRSWPPSSLLCPNILDSAPHPRSPIQAALFKPQQMTFSMSGKC